MLLGFLPLIKTDMSILDHLVDRAVYRTFGCTSSEHIYFLRSVLDLPGRSVCINKRLVRFVESFSHCFSWLLCLVVLFVLTLIVSLSSYYYYSYSYYYYYEIKSRSITIVCDIFDVAHVSRHPIYTAVSLVSWGSSFRQNSRRMIWAVYQLEFRRLGLQEISRAALGIEY